MVWINGFPWTIIYTYDRRFLVNNSGIVTFGVTDTEMRVVYVYAGLKGQMLRKVLMHELAHAFIRSYGLTFPPQYEEAFCGFFDSHAEAIIGITDELYYNNKVTVK